MSGPRNASRGRSRWKRRLVAAALALVVAVWVVGYANGPMRQVRQLTVPRPGGPPAVLTLWEARSLVLPELISNTARQVRLGGTWHGIHGRRDGYGVGPVLVSPDGSQAWVTGTYHGRVGWGILVDLTTGTMRRAIAGSEAYERAGWRPRHWRTTLEPLSTAEVLAVAREDSPERFKLAMDELQARGFAAEDWPAYAAVLLDPTFPVAHRPALAYSVSPAGEPEYDERITFAGGWMDDADPVVRLCAAWAVAEMAIEMRPGWQAPPEFDPAAVWRKDPGERERVVGEVRAWWRQRPPPWRSGSRPAATAPAGRAGP
jgi:hypothetical protein